MGPESKDHPLQGRPCMKVTQHEFAYFLVPFLPLLLKDAAAGFPQFLRLCGLMPSWVSDSRY